MKIKICGLREHSNIMNLAKLQPDWMGFIFYESSPRYFMKGTHPPRFEEIPSSIEKVGIFVTRDYREIMRITTLYNFKTVQLHSDINPTICKQLFDEGINVIKAFNVDERFDFSMVENYAPYCSLFLFDAKGKRPGGNGVRFDWNQLMEFRLPRPFLLSGGIAPEHADEVRDFKHPDCIGVDINSRFEVVPGVKNEEMVKTFMEKIRV